MSDRTWEAVAPRERKCSVRHNWTAEGEQTLYEKVRALDAERALLTQDVHELRTEQQRLLERYIGLEEQSSTLTTLYVACQRLHSSLERAEVLLTVREIVANLVGCEEYVLFSLGPGGWLRRVDSLGVNAEAYTTIPSGHGLIGRAVEAGEVYLFQESDGSTASASDANLTACIPLKRDGAVTGAIALFRLLPQKLDLQELDRELFRLLETHLATALYCTELEERVSTKNGARA